MAFSPEDAERFPAMLREDPDFRERVRREVLSEALLTLPENFAAFRAERAAAQARTDARIDRLAERMDQLTADVQSLAASVNRIDGWLGNVEGQLFEFQFHAQARLVGHLRRVEPVSISWLDAVQDARDQEVITDAELRQLAALDFLFKGRTPGPDRREVYAAVEVSKTVDANEVERADRRARILREADLDAMAFAGGRYVRPVAASRAGELGVTLLVDRETGEEDE